MPDLPERLRAYLDSAQPVSAAEVMGRAGRRPSRVPRLAVAASAAVILGAGAIGVVAARDGDEQPRVTATDSTTTSVPAAGVTCGLPPADLPVTYPSDDPSDGSAILIAFESGVYFFCGSRGDASAPLVFRPRAVPAGEVAIEYLLNELVRGPTVDEVELGLWSTLPEYAPQSLRVEASVVDGVAHLDFRAGDEPWTPGPLTSNEQAALEYPFAATVFLLPEVDRIAPGDLCWGEAGPDCEWTRETWDELVEGNRAHEQPAGDPWAHDLPSLDEFPEVVVAQGTSVVRADGAQITPLTPVPGTAHVAFALGDDLYVQRGPVANEGVLARPPFEPAPIGIFRVRGVTVDLVATRPATFAYLYDVRRVGGRALMLYGTYAAPENAEPTGEIVLRDLATGDETILGAAFRAVYSTHRGSIGDAIIATSAWSDLTEDFSYLSFSGNERRDLPDPTDALQYNAPPSMQQVALSPDGTRLAYLEGPDFDGLTQRTVGEWQAVVLDLASGDELLRTKIAGQELDATWLDYDGRFVVVSGAVNEEPVAPLVIDTAGDAPRADVIASVAGVATLPR